MNPKQILHRAAHGQLARHVFKGGKTDVTGREVTALLAGQLNAGQAAEVRRRLATDPAEAARVAQMEADIARSLQPEAAAAMQARLDETIETSVAYPEPNPRFLEFLRSLVVTITQLLPGHEGDQLEPAFGFAGTGTDGATIGDDRLGTLSRSRLPDGTVRIEITSKLPGIEGVKIEFIREDSAWRREAVMKHDPETGQIKAVVDIPPGEALASFSKWEAFRVRPVSGTGKAWNASAPEPASARPVPPSVAGGKAQSSFTFRVLGVDALIRCGTGRSLSIELSAEKIAAIDEVLAQGGVQVGRHGIPLAVVGGEFVQEGRRWIYRIDVPAHEAAPDVVLIARRRFPIR